jgi:hypothetical protein
VVGWGAVVVQTNTFSLPTLVMLRNEIGCGNWPLLLIQVGRIMIKVDKNLIKVGKA